MTLHEVRVKVCDRSDAVNLARNIRESGKDITRNGISCLVDAVLRMDEHIRASESYAKANPLGGPARMFESMAARIRAGEDYYSVLDDYDLQHKPT